MGVQGTAPGKLNEETAHGAAGAARHCGGAVSHCWGAMECAGGAAPPGGAAAAHGSSTMKQDGATVPRCAWTTLASRGTNERCRGIAPRYGGTTDRYRIISNDCRATGFHNRVTRPQCEGTAVRLAHETLLRDATVKRCPDTTARCPPAAVHRHPCGAAFSAYPIP
ncbi:hypothetical protein [Parapedobacter sp. 10938]|uniref:hypothetical protein n=1 Tax=Parapedobacter flavus TaxID=3110225 RepID=UPI002DB9F70B|nr:hypothetical protein [Parapedobacter sp. 10938]MEC3880463.1 hypothetical protein [Parapedobacter sp. 10938]